MASTAQYKLTYFDIRGLGECIKYIFAYKRIKYELETIQVFALESPLQSEWFKTIKGEMPFGQLPILDIDGNKRLYQSIAICWYLGNQHQLDGGSPWDDAQLMAMAGSLHDMHMRAASYYYERSPEKKEVLRQERVNVSIPFYYKRFEDILQEKGDFLHGKLTWLDFYIVAGLEHINGMMGHDHITGVYPNLENYMNRVRNLPGVKEYITSRPILSR